MYDSSNVLQQLLLILCSCEDPDSTQSPAYPRPKATMATIRKPVVCRMYNTDYRKLTQGWNSSVYLPHCVALYGPPLIQYILGFVAFDAIKSVLQDENGKISGPRTVVAGFGAGFTESLFAVTPFESIKTQLQVPLLFLLSSTDQTIGSTTGSLPTLGCVVSCTVASSFSRKEVSRASSKALCPPRPDRPPTRQPDSQPTQH